MVLKINKWYGRLGNNIFQLINIIRIALYYQHDIIYPEHKFFKSYKTIKIDKNNKNKNIILTDKFNNSNFFYFSKIKLDNQINIYKSLKIKMDEVKKLLRKIFIFNYKDVKLYDDNQLIIYIRSGDIFENNFKSKSYIPPPYYFYQRIINNANYHKIRIIAENKNNPIINKLLSKYKNIKFKQQNLKDDIKIILGAKNIVMGLGSLVLGLLFLTKNTKKIFISSFVHKDYIPKNIKIHCINLNEYKKKLKDKWHCNKDNIKILLKYRK